jgi:peptide subunit release factor 1 (eRF1)
MLSARQLQELESFEPCHPFVSLYLDVQHGDDTAETLRVFVRARFREEVARAGNKRTREYLEESARRITASLEDVIHGHEQRGCRGLAVFHCAPRKLYHTAGSQVPFENALIVAEGPQLEPLRAQIGQLPRVLACLVDSRSARIFELGPGSLQLQAELRSEMPRRHSPSGWSLMRFQRQAAAHLEHHEIETAAVLAQLSDREPSVPVVLAGSEKIVASFRKHLPERVRTRVAAGLPVSLKAQERAIVDRILEGYEREGTEKHQREIEQRAEEALAPGRGAQGVDAVLDAANERAVRYLFLSPGFEALGARCKSCGALAKHALVECSYCSEEVSPSPLRSELIRNVLVSGGEVLTLPARFDVRDGVMALLRHRS